MGKATIGIDNKKWEDIIKVQDDWSIIETMVLESL
jgi:hypothetical protein